MTMLMYTAHLQREDALLLRVVYQTALDVTYRVKLKLREGGKNHRKVFTHDMVLQNTIVRQWL